MILKGRFKMIPFNKAFRRKLIKGSILLFLSILTGLGLGAPLNNVKARRRPVRHHRRIRFNRHRLTHYRINHHYTTPYPTINDHVKRVNQKLTWIKHPKDHRETIKSTYGPKVTFKTLFFISSKAAGRNYLVQSLNVTPDGHYAYVGYGHNPQLKHGRDLTKVAKINVRNRHVKVSRAFNGGHGQALAYDPAKPSLWLLEDHHGPIHRGRVERISMNSLRPQHRINFRLKTSNALGDSLTFDNRNHVYNENLIWRRDARGHFRSGMIILYRGFLNRKHVRFNNVLQGLRHSPGEVIQGIAYNPVTKRLYIEANDAIVSIPIHKLGHLRSSDVKETILRQRREYEGISFDGKGHAYILMNDPKEVMRSTRVF